jgi:hypothetical protein
VIKCHVFEYLATSQRPAVKELVRWKGLCLLACEERFTFVLRNSEMRNIAQESKQNKYNVALGDVLCVCGILACN